MATTRRADGPPIQNGDLSTTLAQVMRRLRLARWLRLASRGGLIAVALSLLVVGLAHWHLLPEWLPLVGAIPALLVIGFGAGTALALRQRTDPMAAARLTEARLGLKERLSSALEFGGGGQIPSDPESALLLRLQQEDAAAAARAVQPADAAPIKLPWEAKALIPALILLLLALILPTLSMFVPPAIRAERAVVQKSGQRISESARRIDKQADSQGLPATKRAAQEMQRLGKQMTQGKMDKKQAMVRMAQLSKQMSDDQQRLAQPESGEGQGNAKSLPQAGQDLAHSLRQAASSQASSTNAGHGQPHPGNSSHGQSPQKAAGRRQSQAGAAGKAGASQNNNETGEMQKAAQALQQGDASGLSRQLRSLAQRTAAGRMTPAQQKRAAQDIHKLAHALRGTPLGDTQRHAQAAADAMRRGDRRSAADELRQAADAADQSARRQQDAQELQNAQQSLQRSEQQMAQAQSPRDIPSGTSASSASASGQASPPSGPQTARSGSKGSQGTPGGPNHGSSGQAKSERNANPSGTSNPATGSGSGDAANGQSSGQGGPASGGAGKSNPSGEGHSFSGSGPGQSTAPSSELRRGAAHPLDPKFDPAKNPAYGKIYLGAGAAGKGSSAGQSIKTTHGAAKPPTGHSAGTVPYTDALAPASKSAESMMDREDIPPSYRGSVRRYFDSLQPSPSRAGSQKAP